ncbi:MAG: amino acid adenylation domain-containing protein [Pyrinomonadaceae bacterium]
MKSQNGKTSNIEDIFPMTSLQEGMLFHTLYAPDERHYLDHLVCELRARGGLDVSAFHRAFQEVVRRHQSLRTAFVWKLDKRPHQVVLRRLEVPLQQLDWRGAPADEQGRRLDEFLNEDRARGYDLSRPPLMRLAMIRVAEEAYQFVLSYHHIIMDGWSTSTVFQELAAFYESFARDRSLTLAPPRPFRSYVDWFWQRGLDEAEAFWRRELAGFVSPTPLVGDATPSATAEDEGDGSAQVSLSSTTTAALQSFARRHGLTLNTIVQGAWGLLLSRYSNSTDVLFGVVVSGRPHELAGVEAMVGLFTNTLPLRVEVAPGQGLLDWLRQLQRKQFELRRYEWSPLAKVQEWSGVPAGTPLFESIVIFQNLPVDESLGRQAETGLSVSVLRHDPRNNFPLTLMCIPADRLALRVFYDARRFAAAIVRRILGHLTTVLEAVAETTVERPLREIPFLTARERREALVEWNDTRAPAPRYATAHEQFEAQAAQTPDAVAAVCVDDWVSYGELNRRANRLAHALAEQSLPPESVVALYGERNIDFLAGLLGIFKAGCAYLPLDPRYPEQRLRQIVELSGAAVLVVAAAFSESAGQVTATLPTHLRPRLLTLEEVLRRPSPSGNPGVRCEPSGLAYVIYTSGSTGQPKGAMIEHRGMMNHLQAKLRDLGVTARDVIAQTASQSFDISVWQFLTALLRGGRVHILGEEVTHDPRLLLNETEKSAFTILEIVPSMLRAMLEEAASRGAARPRLSGLSHLLVTGEELPPDLCRGWLGQYPGIPLVNAYGPTECSDDVTHEFIARPPREGAPRVPIGRPLINTRLYTLDRWLEPTGALVAGELYVAGDGVGRGYLHDPARTAEAFVPNPFAQTPGERLYKTGDLARHLPGGALEFLGRVDHQVKIRGFRIELGEIEALLRRHPGVREAVVLAQGREAGDSRLLGYVTPELQFEGEPGEARGGAERVADWELIFDDAYRQNTVSEKDSSLHFRVWVNSYTNQPFSEAEVFESVEDSVARILALRPKRVLEIGCGSGLLLSRIAPQCEFYCGTDISEEALRSLGQRVEADERLAGKVTLLRRAAHEFDDLPGGDFDVLVLNEVVQYFPDVEYLLEVLKGAVGIVREGGYVFAGGLRNFLLLDAFHTSVQLFQAPDSLPVSELGRRVRAQLAKEKELAVAPAFFHALREELPRISAVRLIPKGGSLSNEFTKFRYDAVLRVGGNNSLPASREWGDWREGGWTPDSLAQRLASAGSEPLALACVPNARVLDDVRAVDLLAKETPAQTAGELRQLLAATASEVVGVDPEPLQRAARERRREVEFSWADTDETGRFELFERGEDNDAEPPRVRHATTRLPWAAYANRPRTSRPAADLIAALKTYLRSHLPDYMVPSELTLLPTLPLTPNGKIDRRALLAATRSAAAAGASGEGVRTPTEELLIPVWSELLGARVGPQSDFFESGGHSLLGTQVISRVRKVFSVELPLRTLFDAPKLSAFARAVDRAVSESQGLATTPPLLRVGRGDGAPLSFAQERLWVMSQMGGEDWAYNLPVAVRVEGELHPAAFEAALSEIIARHESLRTTFDVVDTEPVQLISEPWPLRLPSVDLRGLAPERKESEVRRLALEESRRPFDLRTGPMLRACLLRLDERTSVVLFTMHHIVSDAWSIGVLMSELTALYNAYKAGRPSPLEELPVQYADFAQWQRGWLRGEALEKQLSYWKQQLAGAPAELRLPLDRPRSRLPHSGGRSHGFQLTPESSAALEELCRKESVTPFMAMLAAFKLLLHQITGDTDIVVGTDVANRNVSETEGLIGFFINLLVLRTRLAPDLTYREMLARVRETALGAYAHQDLPFSLLTKEIKQEREMGKNPLFDVLFVFQNAPFGSLALADASLSGIPIDYQTARFDLALFISQSPDRLAGHWTFRDSLFEPATVARWSAHYERLVEDVLRNPDARLDELARPESPERQAQDALREKSFSKFKSLRPKGVVLPT